MSCFQAVRKAWLHGHPASSSISCGIPHDCFGLPDNVALSMGCFLQVSQNVEISRSHYEKCMKWFDSQFPYSPSRSPPSTIPWKEIRVNIEHDAQDGCAWIAAVWKHTYICTSGRFDDLKTRKATWYLPQCFFFWIFHLLTSNKK